VNYDDGHRGPTTRLPKAVAQNADAILNGDQPPFRLGEIEFAPYKEARNGLDVSTAQKTARTEFISISFVEDAWSRDSSHPVILNK
jgi:hypothetical protein